MKKTRILICGILPPPNFGHSMMYKMLMESRFIDAFDVIFLNMGFWSYEKHKKITLMKLLKLIKYYVQYIFLLIFKRPSYVLYNMSFDKMPFLKDFLFCMTARWMGCRFVIHDMGQYLRELYEGNSSFYQKLIRHLMNHTTASIVLGEKTRQIYKNFLDLKKVIAVPGAVGESHSLVGGSQNSNDKTNHTIRVLYLSFLSISKGFLTALEAIPHVIKKNSNVQFTFAGPFETKDLQGKAERFVKEHQLESYVKFVGYVDEAKSIQCFRQSDIFIFPTHRDVFGLVLLHAMAESLPIISTKEGNIPDIVKEPEGGFLIPKGDEDQLAEKILFLVKNEHLRKKMGQHNRERYLKCYTQESYGQRMIQAFNEIHGVEGCPSGLH